MKIRTITNPKLVTKKIGDGYKLYVKDGGALLPIDADLSSESTNGYGTIISNPDFIVRIINGKANLYVRDGRVIRPVYAKQSVQYTVEVVAGIGVELNPEPGTYTVSDGGSFNLQIVELGPDCSLRRVYDNDENVTRDVDDNNTYHLTGIHENHTIEVDIHCGKKI